MFSKGNFARRHNRDGSHDSICTVCLVTVATVRDEEQLTSYEATHVCDPVNLYRINQDRLPLRSQSRDFLVAPNMVG